MVGCPSSSQEQQKIDEGIFKVPNSFKYLHTANNAQRPSKRSCLSASHVTLIIHLHHLPYKKALSETQIHAAIQAVVDDFRGWTLASIIHYPEEAGLEYEDIFFQSEAGVPLEGWFILCKSFDKITIVNYPHQFSRAGLPSHLEPWNSLVPGNDFDVNFIPDYMMPGTTMTTQPRPQRKL